ncbi:beta strand repeat-containing protein [Megasphaera cerevisiae]|uniref:beta strand repeat-containing protein n=1 Tax=Megasphaera cerevisiae TaxID=39029 RepID=UPI000941E80D|nr:hypothetical protein [Megasphaera cerevisiae]OKY53487.1 hypothetical protein BSR42_07300 [Megasphaera cerevisiae]
MNTEHRENDNGVLFVGVTSKGKKGSWKKKAANAMLAALFCTGAVPFAVQAETIVLTDGEYIEALKQAGVEAGTVGDGADTFLALGTGSLVDNKGHGTAVGNNASSQGNRATAFGALAFAKGEDATAVGGSSEASAAGATSIGAWNSATQENATAIGFQSHAYDINASSFGANAYAFGENSVALGQASETAISEDNVVSVGKSGTDGFTRRVINIADGIRDTDAATIGQTVTYDRNADGSVNKRSVTFAGVTDDKGHNAGTKLKNVDDIVMNTTNFFNGKAEQHSFQEAGLIPGIAHNKYSTAVGYGSEVEENVTMSAAFGAGAAVSQAIVDGEYAPVERSLALGQGARVSASKSVAIGQGSNVGKDDSIAVGQGSAVQSINGIAIGKVAKIGTGAENSIAIGSPIQETEGGLGGGHQFSVGSGAKNSTVVGIAAYSGGESGSAFGQGAMVQGGAAKSTALGAGSSVTTVNSVALGADSSVGQSDVPDTDIHGVVSVGKSGTDGFTRRIINVAVGRIETGSHDAVTGGQLAAAGIVPGTVDAAAAAGLALGEGSYVKYQQSTAVGNGSQIHAAYGVAVGKDSTIGSAFGTVIGQGSMIGENVAYSTLVGQGSSITVKNSGFQGYSTLIGQGSSINNASYATIVGSKSNVTGTNGVALGYQSFADAYNTVALGADSVAKSDAVVSVGHKGGDKKADGTTYETDLQRRITNVKDGRDDNDAANMKQVNAVKDSVIDLDALTVKYDDATKQSITVGGAKLQNVGDIQMGTQTSTFAGAGLVNGKVYAAKDGWTENGAADTKSAAIGKGSSVRGAGSLSVGNGASVNTANANVDAGWDAFQNAQGTAIGVNANVTGVQSTAVGYGAKATKNQSVAAGNQAQATENGGAAFGQNAVVNAVKGTALGLGASVGTGADNSVALGAGSVVFKSDLLASDIHGIVSVGKSNATRRIINVSDGVKNTDAVNMKQLNGIKDSVTGLADGAVLYDQTNDENGKIVVDKTNVTFNKGGAGTTLKNVADIELAGKSLVGAGVVAGTLGSEYTSHALALGVNSVVADGYGTAVGDGASTDGAQASAFGASAKANGMNATAVGGTSSAGAKGATVVGAQSGVSNAYGTAIGQDSHVYAEKASAFGANTWAYGAGSVALGQGSRTSTTDTNVISVGNSTGLGDAITRRVINVADGIDLHDAATVGQIQKITGVDVAKGNVVQYDSDGNLNVAKGDSGLKVNDESSSISHGNNSVTANKDSVIISSGTNGIKVTENGNTITGDTTVHGDLNVTGTINGTNISDITGAVQDVSGLKKIVGTDKIDVKGTDGKVAETLTGAVNANAAKIGDTTKLEVITGKNDSSVTDAALANHEAINTETDALQAADTELWKGVDSLGRSVHQLGEEVDSVGAISAALAGLHPLPFEGASKFQLSAAVGTYDGTQAAALG